MPVVQSPSPGQKYKEYSKYRETGRFLWLVPTSQYNQAEQRRQVVFGHTRFIKDPVIRENFAAMDCRKVFEMDAYGNITEVTKP